jgi:hypothetical protein
MVTYNKPLSLHPTISKIRITGGRLEYQQRVIFRLIEEFGLNTIVYIQPPPMGELGCIPFVQKRLEQCMNLGYDSNYLVIQDTSPGGHANTDTIGPQDPHFA